MVVACEMLGLMTRSLLIRVVTEIRNDLLTSAWEFESTVRF
jgi:hypothetical protein